jgi:Bifunctional DNA primase/polymerase, N-terminal
MSRSDRATAQRLRIWPLLQAGLYPVPVHPQSRRLLVPWGEIDRLGYRPGAQALPDDPELGAKLHLGEGLPYESLVFEWWDRWPAAGAAILTGLSRLLVVDVDPRSGGHASLARLVRTRPLPATRVVGTRGGGVHLYYRTATLVKSKAGSLGPGLDVKSYRGVVFCPPTPGYRILERRAIAPAPGWLVRRCGRPYHGGGRHAEKLAFSDPKVAAAVAHAVARILDAPPGEQHNVVYGQARHAFKHCLDDRVTAALADAAATIAPEPWRRPNWERAIADARRKEGGP